MTKIFSCFIAVCIISGGVFAQTKPAAKPLKKIMTFEIPGDGGSNGGSVAWHPVYKQYYAAMAGNATFQMAIFDIKGKRVSAEDLETMFDVRGMWYNPVTKSLHANGYKENGWIKYKMTARGIISDIDQLQEGMVQPDEQSVGFLDVKTKRVCFLSGSNIVQYSDQGEALDEVIELKIPQNEDAGEDADPMELYNTTTVCYTGLPNAEFALLKYLDREIELYNRKGAKTKTIKLPEDAPANASFNFAYANGIWWLFDKEERKWYGYK